MAERNRARTFEYFSGFINPCFSMDVRMDVTEVVELSRRTGTSFFINTLYLVTTALHSIEEMRFRILDGDVVCYDVIHPGFTVMTDNGAYRNSFSEMSFDYSEFYSRCRAAIDYTREHPDDRDDPSNAFVGRLDVFYFSCIPWIDFRSMSHPLPLGEDGPLSIPRIVWGRYVEENGRLMMTMNLTADHALMDGYQMAMAFKEIQKRFDDPGSYIVTDRTA